MSTLLVTNDMLGDNIRIPDEEVSILKKICKIRANGQSSVGAIFKDMRRFIKEDFKDELMKLSVSGGIESTNSNWKDVYYVYEKFLISDTSLKSAFYGKGISRKFELLPTIVKLYIERFKHLIGSNAIQPIPVKEAEYQLLLQEETGTTGRENNYYSSREEVHSTFKNIESGGNTTIHSKKPGDFHANGIQSGENTELHLQHTGSVDISNVKSKRDTVVKNDELS